MADSFPGAPGGRTLPDPPTDEPRLESWGEIASYLRREIRTVQRWETYQCLPIRRLKIGKSGPVYAYRSELDKWFRERQPAAENGDGEEEKSTNGEFAADFASVSDAQDEKSNGDVSRGAIPLPRRRITRLHITITLLTL